ncbi:purple acid phosphatase family protein [Spirosoma oryzicola]|uniref:purple acid phosphatase family protein n=1 Tax=Spirosoma oryzicola TaxID=2898794 RepID=UPI001E30A223|nr:metallophosphoesterase family protein [Spirosoma oryzicola]UHG89323.1 metallophosphoesterase family protein [Spirosoma oryzicola]
MIHVTRLNRLLQICSLLGWFATATSAQQTGSLVRGPYLQKATPTSMTLRWRTNSASLGVVRYGTSADKLNKSTPEAENRTDHEVTLTGLKPNTKYFYSIGTETTPLAGSDQHYFYTFPVEGTVKKTRIWSLGDFGNRSARQYTVKNAFKNYVQQMGDPYIDLWLWLGDNAYNRGLDKEYQTNVFSADTGYSGDRFMRQTPIFATPGNHDYAGNNDLRLNWNIPYFGVVSHPTNAEAGGIPSGSEAYYSFNYGNIHFVSLDSDRYDDSTSKASNVRFGETSPQLNWLKRDLTAAQTNPNITWIIAYWHHPPYTKGTHDSDKEKQLRDVRMNLLPVLEQYNVDLVMCGHSHVYERSDLLKGHYGDEPTFDASTHNHPSVNAEQMTTATSSVKATHFIKHRKATANEGTIYVVNGDGGAGGGHVSAGTAQWPHNAMDVSYDGAGGSMYIEVDGDKLEATMIAGDGSIQDQFTISKENSRSKRK